MMRVDRDLAERHYGEHREKPFFGELVDFITGGPRGRGAGCRAGTPSRCVRTMMGSTDPAASRAGDDPRRPGASTVTDNLIHGSDSPESAERELALFFG